MKAKASRHSTYTKYSARVKFAQKGRWRVRTYVLSGDWYASAWSSGFDYLTVK